ncbi:kinase-like protein [Suillus hirtellus]|nr:kinase-like protein [Suillus hirtellus]
MENDNVRTEDLPDDLTPFITRIAMDHVGAGSYGDVWKCNYSDDANGISALVAVKAFKLPEHYDLEKLNRKINREIGILKILHHDNIVPLLGIATGFGYKPELRCLVSPWMPNGTLNAYLVSNHDHLTVLDRSRMLEDVSAGLRYLHSKAVMHGDITGANILIDKGGHARLIDFGLSTITQPLLGQSHLAVTSIHHGAIPYAAPELILPDTTCDPGLVEKIDIYSFGCVMLQILSGRPPWSEIKSARLVACITNLISQGRRPQRPDGHPRIIDSDWKFIQKCWQSEPHLRPSANEVLDFVMHKFSSPDSCSGPPSDDGPDNDPRASPCGGSNESDTAEKPLESLPLHPDHGPRTFFTVTDSLFTPAESLSASTSSTSIFSTPRLSCNDSSNAISGSSTRREPMSHTPSEMFQCMWVSSHGLRCNDLFLGYNLSAHLREAHGIRGSYKSRVICMWDGCNVEFSRESFWRHVEDKHLGIVYPCECGKMFSRRDALNRHRRTHDLDFAS